MKNFIVLLYNSDTDMCYQERIYGLPENARKYVCKLLIEARNKDTDTFEAVWVTEDSSYQNSYYGVAQFMGYHITVSLFLDEDVPLVTLPETFDSDTLTLYKKGEL